MNKPTPAPPSLHQIVRVKLASIDQTPHYQIRLGKRGLRNVASLRSEGQQDPVHLQRTRRDKLRILDGHDRIQSAQALGWVDIGALLHDVDDQEARRLSWTLNAARVEFTPLERLNAIELFADSGMKNADIAATLGFKHEKSVSRLRSSLPLSHRYWTLLREGRLLPKHILALRRVPPAKWDAFVKRTLEEGLSANALALAVKPRRRRVVEERPGGAFTVWSYIHDPNRDDSADEVERHAEQLDRAADQLRAWCRHRRQQERSGRVG